MKAMKILCSVMLFVILSFLLVSCSTKDASQTNSEVALNLIKTINLNAIIEEMPAWEVAEDRIFLACPQEIAIRSIDFEGNLLNELTTVGMGPGEIKQFNFPFLDSQKKEFFYVEWSQNKYVYYDYNLNFLRGEDRGLDLLQYYKSYPGKSVKLDTAYGSKDGKMVANLKAGISLEDTTIVIAKSEIDISNYDFETELKIATNGKVIAQYKSASGDINFNIFDMAGNKLREFLYSHSKVQRPDEYLEAIKEQIKKGANFSNFKFEPAITEMAIDGESNIWLTTWDEDHKIKMLVFSESGELLKEFESEEFAYQIKILDDKLFKLRTTEEINQIEIYKIEG